MSLQQILLFIHSWVRWLVLLVAVVALVRHVLGWLRRDNYDGAARGLLSAFSGLIDLNVLIGVIQLIAFWRSYSAAAGGFPMPQVEHLGAMLIAAIIAHLPARLWRNSPDANRYRNTAIAILVSVLVIIAGIMPLVGDRWVFRGF